MDIQKQLLDIFVSIEKQLIEDENNVIITLIHSDKIYDDFFSFLMGGLQKYEPTLLMNPNIKGNTRRIKFNKNSNQIKILTLESIQTLNPKDLVKPKLNLEEAMSDKYGEKMEKFNNEVFELWKRPLHTLLLNMPDEFYNENITIENCEFILDKYKQYIKL